MAFPNAKPPVAMSAIAQAAGLPPGKKMSIRNLAKRGAMKRAPKAMRDDGDHEYR